jgi:2-oxoglutarate dehydrogenase E2 component (dihydrolipoamide succinyltransferase)
VGKVANDSPLLNANFQRVNEMKPAKPAKKPNSGAPGVKLLITAASLAATLGGWAVISGQEAKPAPAPTPEPATAPAVTIKLAPLPTLVPEVTPQAQLVMVNRPRPAAAAPQPAAAAPQPAAPGTIVLRDVSAPAPRDAGAPQVGGGRSAAPAPVANTRSSR